jgi:Helix-hairpin-helix motif
MSAEPNPGVALSRVSRRGKSSNLHFAPYLDSVVTSIWVSLNSSHSSLEPDLFEEYAHFTHQFFGYQPLLKRCLPNTTACERNCFYCSLAESHLLSAPVDVMKADRRQLMRIPGIGPVGATAIIQARRLGRLTDLAHLRKLNIRAPEQAAPYILLDGRRPATQMRLF